MSNHLPNLTMSARCISPEVNALIMGALAWTGYLEKSRGAVVVYASQEDEDPLEEPSGQD